MQPPAKKLKPSDDEPCDGESKEEGKGKDTRKTTIRLGEILAHPERCRKLYF